eukprot:359869-Chlamydomonas_euryale.AAC.2
MHANSRGHSRRHGAAARGGASPDGAAPISCAALHACCQRPVLFPGNALAMESGPCSADAPQHLPLTPPSSCTPQRAPRFLKTWFTATAPA